MKTTKTLFLLIVILMTSIGTYAQKFAYVDSDYILSKMPEFIQAEEKIAYIDIDFLLNESIAGKLITNNLETKYKSNIGPRFNCTQCNLNCIGPDKNKI